MDVLKNNKKHIIFDPLYGFIQLTPIEWKIIHSPFYQRLRWIKQLGFSFYVFPGAEHSRFGHSIGVMHNAHEILKICKKSVSNEELMDATFHSKDKDFHQIIRLGALMHDLGTFPFSHTTEGAYIDFGETTNSKGGKGLQDDHENLGSFIIKNTNYEGGITRILTDFGYDPKIVSDYVKGIGPSVFGNQILHSDIDCDRMDYLLRDAHYTGLKYGSYDRDYLLFNFKTMMIENQEILTIRHNAIHCIEDFLLSRFSWYSQVIRSPRGAKYDAIAARLCFHMLEKNLVYKYSDLLDLISYEPMKFFGFNDNYFITSIQQFLGSGAFDKYGQIKDMAETLLFKKGSKTIRANEFNQRLLNQDDLQNKEKVVKKAESKLEEIRRLIDKKGTPRDWVIPDLPSKDLSMVSSYKKLVKNKTTENVLLERDPVKISFENGDIKLLVDVENSIINSLQNTNNYLPNVFCSKTAYNLLLEEKIIEGERLFT